MNAMVLHECDPGLVPLGRRYLPGGVSLQARAGQTACRMLDHLLATRMVFSLVEGYLVMGMRVAGETLKL